MQNFEKPLLWIVIVGGLLWGFEGITDTQVQELIFGDRVANAINILIAAAAVVLIYLSYSWLITKPRGKAKKK